MNNIQTGKEEHMKRSIQKVQRILSTQPDYMSGFYYYMRTSGKTASYLTHENYVKHVIKFLKYMNKDATEVTMDDITRYLSDISVKPDGTQASGSYLVAVYSGLKKFYKYMLVSKKIAENPMENIERPTPKKAEMVNRTYLSKTEIKKLFRLFDNHELSIWEKRDRAILMLFFSTGIRNTCLTEINIQNIDFENSCIYVLDKGTKPKTCYLGEDKMRILKEWVEVRELYNTDNLDALFIGKRRTRIEQLAVARMIKKYTGMIGHEITPHKARASFATNALNSGASLYEVSKLMNHSSTKVTSDCYIQGQEEKIKEAGLKATSYLKF